MTAFAITVFKGTSQKELGYQSGTSQKGVGYQSGTSQIIEHRPFGPNVLTLQERLIEFCSEPKTLREIADFLGASNKKKVKAKYIDGILGTKIAMTVPDKPNSRLQKYVAIRQLASDAFILKATLKAEFVEEHVAEEGATDGETGRIDVAVSLDAVQKGRTIHEDVAQDLLKRGLIEGEASHYSISLSIAKGTRQLSSYTKTKGLDKEKLRQMILQYLKNAGVDGAKRDSILEYLKDVLPQNKTEEQKLRTLGDLLKSMKLANVIKTDGRNWYLSL